jgi:hypothetical protein
MYVYIYIYIYIYNALIFHSKYVPHKNNLPPLPQRINSTPPPGGHTPQFWNLWCNVIFESGVLVIKPRVDLPKFGCGIFATDVLPCLV